MIWKNDDWIFGIEDFKIVEFGFVTQSQSIPYKQEEKIEHEKLLIFYT
jgi:hypothetical protein